MTGLHRARREAHALLVIGFLTLATACAGGAGTGTGSSGLIGAEGVLVDRVIETGTCEAFEGVDYCPADAPDALPSGKFISTPFEDDASIGCFRSSSGAALCLFVFSFEPQGFEDSQEFVIALRGAATEEPWELFSLSEPPMGDEEDADLIVSSIVVDLADDAGEEIQLAILAFESQAQSLPETVETLAELGAETVFLVPPLAAIPEVPDEEAALEQARGATACAVTGIVSFCPTDVTFPPGSLDPAVGPPPFPSTTRIDFTSPSPIPCRLSGDGTRCTAEVGFSVLGDVGFYYRPAARVRTATPRPWFLGFEVEEPLEIDLDVPRPFTTTATVDLTGLDREAPFEIDLVLLVDALDPADLADSVPTLHEAVPDYAFVPPPLLLEVTE